VVLGWRTSLLDLTSHQELSHATATMSHHGGYNRYDVTSLRLIRGRLAGADRGRPGWPGPASSGAARDVRCCGTPGGR